MTVRYVLGRSGQGKSHYIYNEIRQALSSEDGLILLVPEQYTLQAERDLIKNLGTPGILDIEVLSLSRLAERIFQETGAVQKVLISEQGRNMVLKKSIASVSRSLTIFRRASGQEGFIVQCADFVSELKKRGITPLQLDQTVLELPADSMVRQKLADLHRIYQAFNDYLAEHYIDLDDYMNHFIARIRDASILRNARVWIDSFTTYSPQSLRIIKEIIAAARETTITITMDPDHRGRDREVFTLSDYSLEQIRSAARSHNLNEEIINISPPGVNAFKPPELLHIEAELYAYPWKQWPGKPVNIEVYAASTVNAEVEYLAARVLSLVRDGGYRWRDIAVVSNAMELYAPLIKRVFNDFDIPYFIDQKRDIIHNPIIGLILSSLQVLQRGYRYDDVFKLLKTGFTGLHRDACELLENYALAYGIKGHKWREPFVWGDPQSIMELNTWREEFLQPLLELENKLQAASNCKDMTIALYTYLESIQIRAKLQLWSEDLRCRNFFEPAAENAQIWNIVVEIFEQMVEILGDQQMGIKEYHQVLETGFLSFEIGLLPTTVDQVIVGDVNRSKNQDLKALFILGVNDGVLPAGKDAEDIISMEEKQFLKNYGLETGLDRDMKTAEERLLIYSALSKPVEELGISFAQANNEGKALRPSLLVNRLQQLFKGLTIKSDLGTDAKAELQKVANPVGTFRTMVENLRLHLDAKPAPEFWWDVYAWYCTQADWKARREHIAKAYFHQNQVADIDRQLVKKLYKWPLRTSVSRLENYIRCPFSHFVQYGLKPRERKAFAIEAPDIGDILHNALFQFARQMDTADMRWSSMERNDCYQLMDAVLDEILPVYRGGILVSTSRYRHLAHRLKRIGRRAVWTLLQHIQQGDFEPAGYELRFGVGENLPAIAIKLEDEATILLEGRIDRVDILTGDNGDYVKIIDYKTGSRDLNLTEIYYGLSIQLLVYLRAVLAVPRLPGSGVAKPAGIFYFKIDDPLINTDEKITAYIEKQMARELRMNGLVLKDVNIVRHIDRGLQGTSDIIPVAVKKDDDFDTRSSVLDEAEFAAFLRHLDRIIKETGRGILKGKVRIEPVKMETMTACMYCRYTSICQFDRLFIDNCYRRLTPLENDQVKEAIMAGGEVSADGQLER